MDSIDITDSAFSLDVPDLNQVMNTSGGSVNTDYLIYIYIGVAIFVILVGIFFYKIYKNKNTEQNVEDCPGGFCTMNENPRHI